MICINDNMRVISDHYSEALINEIRDQGTESSVLADRLCLLGQRAGQVISGELFTEKRSIITPMGHSHTGLHLSDEQIVVISTKDDYEYFAKGISGVMKNTLRGYMDFDGARGIQALTQPIRSIKLPDVEDKQSVSSVLIAKAILATGCTAISLMKKAIELYNPRHIIIASVFYTERGVYDVLNEAANTKIYVFGNPDDLNEDGMLIPGVGDLDTRLKQ